MPTEKVHYELDGSSDEDRLKSKRDYLLSADNIDHRRVRNMMFARATR